MEEFDDATYGWDIKRRIFFITETFISTATFASGEHPGCFVYPYLPFFFPDIIFVNTVSVHSASMPRFLIFSADNKHKRLYFYLDDRV